MSMQKQTPLFSYSENLFVGATQIVIFSKLNI